MTCETKTYSVGVLPRKKIKRARAIRSWFGVSKGRAHADPRKKCLKCNCSYLLSRCRSLISESNLTCGNVMQCVSRKLQYSGTPIMLVSDFKFQWPRLNGIESRTVQLCSSLKLWLKVLRYHKWTTSTCLFVYLQCEPTYGFTRIVNLWNRNRYTVDD